MIKVTASQVAALCGATMSGPDVELSNLAGIKEAAPGDLSVLHNPRYAKYLKESRASAIIVHPKQAGEAPAGRTLLVTDNPYLCWAKVITLYAETIKVKPVPGIHPTAVVDPSARIDPSCTIGAHAVIDAGVKIGPNTVVYPLVYIGRNSTIGRDGLVYSNVAIRENCCIGDRVIIHCGSVIGGDGFGYAQDGPRHYKIPQIGTVAIEDDVEIGCACTIDRGVFGPTTIKRGTKLDNQVQVAHNVTVGEDTLLIAQSAIAGSTTVGDRVVMSGQVGVHGHIRIGNDVRIGAQAGITKSVPDGMNVSGYPAMEHIKARRREA
ncbi:MAG TPA: UDP-3-O-(3-hydroxymyristoyl)glucosamine N-acyltransferase, partial [Candidatus Edwardsbacteria bacterium]|nr:UDP-3-O-(3-hydroxymyristoyl)glucosamine N-acyltransferase [Candidatus Edwardsbacteria bacterium]